MNDSQMPNFAGEAVQVKARFEKILENYSKKPNKEHKLTNIDCNWCGKKIDGDCYYHCKKHKNNFCEDCARNQGRKKTDLHLSTKCKSHDIHTAQECIWNKIILINEDK